MTSLFDGMAGVLNDVFGAPIAWTPAGGTETSIQGVLRHRMVMVADEFGEAVPASMTTLRVQVSDAAAMAGGDAVVASDGTAYTVQYQIPEESPASDRFLTFALELAE